MRKKKDKTFSVVDNPTRLGDTAFFIQAPEMNVFKEKDQIVMRAHIKE